MLNSDIRTGDEHLVMGEDGVERHPMSFKAPPLARPADETYRPKGFVVGPQSQRVPVYAINGIEPSKSNSGNTILISVQGRLAPFTFKYSSGELLDAALATIDAEMSAYAMR
jgi:hypothetical protein